MVLIFEISSTSSHYSRLGSLWNEGCNRRSCSRPVQILYTAGPWPRVGSVVRWLSSAYDLLCPFCI